MPTTKSAKKSEQVDINVGSRVRSLRQQRRMSLTELADQLGITFQQVQKYDKGTNRISSSRLHQIANIFWVPEAYFFEDPLGQFPHQAALTLVHSMRSAAAGTASLSCSRSSRSRTRLRDARSPSWWPI